MRRAFMAGIVGLALAGAAWFGGPAAGQEAPAGSAWPILEDGWEPPRTPWGVPDLTGIWSTPRTSPTAPATGAPARPASRRALHARRPGPDAIPHHRRRPTTWTRLWTLDLALVRQDDTENLIFESACHEGNYSLTGMLAGARIDEQAGR